MERLPTLTLPSGQQVPRRNWTPPFHPPPAPSRWRSSNPLSS